MEQWSSPMWKAGTKVDEDDEGESGVLQISIFRTSALVQPSHVT